MLEAAKEEPLEPLLRKFLHRLKTSDDQRTQRQNNALHLFYTQLSEVLNNSNITIQAVLKHTMEIDWSPRLVKELLWRRMQQAVLGKDSTTELKKLEEIDKIYDHLVRFFAHKGIEVELPPFPHDPSPLKDTQF